MASPDPRPAALPAAVDPETAAAIADYFNIRRRRVGGFVARHFTWPGTFGLHRAALGADVLRAPANIALAPLNILLRLGAAAAGGLRLRRVARRLDGLQLGLPTRLGRRIEALVLTELFEAPVPVPEGRDDGIARAMLATPPLVALARAGMPPEQVGAVADRAARAIGEYCSSRSAVAEMTTALASLTAGAIAFRALTPGVISIAPDLANAVAHASAVAAFPLGDSLGTLWYRAFPVGASAGLVAGTVVVLVLVASFAAAFAGILADPFQARLGIHRRRLNRLIDAIAADVEGEAAGRFVAREHYYARLFDLWDSAMSVTRLFRN